VGERAFEDRDRQYRRFGRVLGELARRARVEDPELPPLSALSLDAAVFTTTETVARYVREGRTNELGNLYDGLLQLLMRLLADDRTAELEGLSAAVG
jgi:hypothetical protein